MEKEEEEFKNLSFEPKKSIYASTFDPNILKQSLILDGLKKKNGNNINKKRMD